MLYNELPIVFPWYEKEEHQDRYRENADISCTPKLISPQNSFLPFQFYKQVDGVLPIAWEVFEANTRDIIIDVSAAISQLKYSSVNGYDYFTFPGTPISIMNLGPGYYYSTLTFASGLVYYSELFFVPDSGRFRIEDDDDIDFIKIQFYNNGDIQPIFYNEQADTGGSFFKQVIYLDSFITSSEPEITADGTKDGNDELIPTFQKAVIKYRISTGAAEYLKKAMVLIPMHDSVILTTKNGVRSGQLQTVAVESSLEGNGAVSIVEFIFEETVAMVKKGCAGNMAKGCPGDSPTMTVLPGTTGNYLIQGYAAPATTVSFYGSNAPDGLKTKIPGLTLTSAAFNAGSQVPTSNFSPYTYIVAKSTSFGCDFGFTAYILKP